MHTHAKKKSMKRSRVIRATGGKYFKKRESVRMLEFRVQSNNVDATNPAAQPEGTSTVPPIFKFFNKRT